MGTADDRAVLATRASGGRLLYLAPRRTVDVVPIVQLARSRWATLADRWGDGVLVLVPARPSRPDNDTALHATHDLFNTAHERWNCEGATSARLASVIELPGATRDVRDLLEVEGTAGALRVLDACWPQLMTSRLAAAFVDLMPHSSVLSILNDSDNDDFFTDTLRTWLLHDRDVPATAGALGLHVNTVRYRLRRAQDQLGLTMDDPHQAVVLQLWALGPA